LQRDVMANMTLTVVVDNLSNEELDMVADKYDKFLHDHVSQLPGKVTECSEMDREEDEPEETDED
jgi:hypothetical protein